MINIISSCTNSKKKIPTDIFKIASYESSMSVDDVLKLWKKHIYLKEEETHVAIDLYKGGAWKATLAIKETLLTKYETNLYIASAGYGLIHDSEQICAYDSTFATSTTNSIRKFSNNSTKDDNVFWWDGVNTFDLNTFSENDYFFIVLPYNYLYAAQNTVKQLINKFKNKIFIFVANQNKLPLFMSSYVIKIDSKFNNFEPGVQSNMLQRAVLWLSKEIIAKDISLNKKELQEHINEAMLKYDSFKMPIREKFSEEELYKKIKTLIEQENIPSASKGLKAFRKLGYACEQKRFGRIFKDIKGTNK